MFGSQITRSVLKQLHKNEEAEEGLSLLISLVSFHTARRAQTLEIPSMSNQKMAGGGNPRGSSSHNKSSSSSTYRKSRWESGNSTTTTTPSDNKPAAVTDPKSSKPTSNQQQSSKPKDEPVPWPSKPPTDPILPSPSSGKFHPPGHGPPFHMPEVNGSPFADPSGFGPPPPPAYGFHMLERRTIVLADGNVRSYFALPLDYQDFPPPGRPGDHHPDRFLPFGPGGGGGGGREPEQGGMGIGFDKHFPPEGFHRGGGGGGREEMYGRGGQSDYWNSLGLDGRGPEGSLKRKYGDEDERDGRDDFSRQRQQLLQYGNPSSNPNGFPGDRVDYMGGAGNPFHRDSMLSGRGIDDLRSSKHIRVGGDYGSSHSRHGEPGNDASLKHPEVDSHALKKAFIHFTKSLIETPQRKNFLEDGKHGPLQCLACGRVSQDMHGLIMHTYTSPDLRVDHLGFHKALCVLMGWNYAKAPDNSKAYQSLSADEAAANKEDLVMWPPTVIIRNTNSGRGKDGRMEGMGNKMMDNKLKDLGFVGGKSKSLYGKDGHLGITLVKFTGDQSGLKDAIRLAEYFEKDNHGRRGWTRAQSSMTGRDDENNPNLVKMDEKTRERTRIHYGYLGTASDLDDVDFETRTKSSLESRKEFKL